jgi:uncharacterized protein
MSRQFGRSAYLSTFEQFKESFITKKGSEYNVFTSFHIAEEIEALGADYPSKATSFIEWFHRQGYRIIADISPRTFQVLEVTSFHEFIMNYPVDVVRPDFGFTNQELIEMGAQVPLMLNASMLDTTLWDALATTKVSALHNFYPRPETGLDDELFDHLNRELQQRSISIHAFVPGTHDYRGPIYEGLPTLEQHRFSAVYASAVDLWWTFGIDGVLIGDMGLDRITETLIEQTLSTNNIMIPIVLKEEYLHLHQQSFTIRLDSPRWLARFLESRQYATKGVQIEPNTPQPRWRGSLTIDNRLYDRYTGEIQLIKEDLPADERVNVIGHVPEEYHLLLDCIENGTMITLYHLTT